MSPLNRKAGARRLVDMSATEASDVAWAPDLPPEGEDWIQTFPISEDAKYVLRMGYDERGRLAEWAVVQMTRRDGVWQRVALYDICHSKGLHVHLYDRNEVQFTEDFIRSVKSYQDVDDGLDDVVDRVSRCWGENERRSDRGY